MEIRGYGDTNILNNPDLVSTKVECVKITGITTSGKNVIVSGVGFERGEINGVFAKKTKFIDIDELLATKGKKLQAAQTPYASQQPTSMATANSTSLWPTKAQMMFRYSRVTEREISFGR